MNRNATGHTHANIIPIHGIFRRGYNYTSTLGQSNICIGLSGSYLVVLPYSATEREAEPAPLVWCLYQWLELLNVTKTDSIGPRLHCIRIDSWHNNSHTSLCYRGPSGISTEQVITIN
ncbi:hypothetical protein V6N13_144431 [Hibiscus sabdariffa]|uniref:Uncharacterized protein n=1 Tax=Hibiscus sabdariffa TaxID=183260 RepID=A0ABR2FKK9_9ROSI